jgi:hypothetical protein
VAFGEGASWGGRHVLNEKRRGRLTWRRIEDALDYKERALLVELYAEFPRTRD